MANTGNDTTNQINSVFGIVSQQLLVPPISTAQPTPQNAQATVEQTFHIVNNGYPRR